MSNSLQFAQRVAMERNKPEEKWFAATYNSNLTDHQFDRAFVDIRADLIPSIPTMERLMAKLKIYMKPDGEIFVMETGNEVYKVSKGDQVWPSV